MADHLVPPYGSVLAGGVVDDERAAELKASPNWPSWDLTPASCATWTAVTAVFRPCAVSWGAPTDAVCAKMRLADGTLWPIPVTLDVTEEKAAELRRGDTLALRDPEGVMLAVIHVEEVCRPDRRREAKVVFGTTDTAHPGVAYLPSAPHPGYVAGTLEVLNCPAHYDYSAAALSPGAAAGRVSKRLGGRRWSPSRPATRMHRAHRELTLRAARRWRPTC